MSATFWNLRKRKKAAKASNASTETPAVTEKKETAEKPVKKGGGKDGK